MLRFKTAPSFSTDPDKVLQKNRNHLNRLAIHQNLIWSNITIIKIPKLKKFLHRSRRCCPTKKVPVWTFAKNIDQNFNESDIKSYGIFVKIISTSSLKNLWKTQPLFILPRFHISISFKFLTRKVSVKWPAESWKPHLFRIQIDLALNIDSYLRDSTNCGKNLPWMMF